MKNKKIPHVFSHLPVTPVFDLERMQKALASKTITLPNGLTREQIKEFILNSAIKND